jgi:hypothetical protein
MKAVKTALLSGESSRLVPYERVIDYIIGDEETWRERYKESIKSMNETNKRYNVNETRAGIYHSRKREGREIVWRQKYMRGAIKEGEAELINGYFHNRRPPERKYYYNKKKGLYMLRSEEGKKEYENIRKIIRNTMIGDRDYYIGY